MGDTGPCGPCTEINYDFIGNRDAAHLVNGTDPSVIEIWNNVFIQFNRNEDKSLSTLPNKHVDTGMGLERICSILQNVDNNYETDLFTTIFKAIQKETNCREYSGKMKEQDKDGIDTAYRVIADHIRMAVISITDGGVPGNDGHKSVIKTVIRRAVRFGFQILKAKVGFFSNLVPAVVDSLKDIFPELKEEMKLVQQIIYDEEIQFSKTIEKGITLFKEISLKSQESGVISGKEAFKLYDTYGFPLELTVVMAEEMNLTVNRKEYFEERKIAV
jgi:alanyl-tRNA synthetase